MLKINQKIRFMLMAIALIAVALISSCKKDDAEPQDTKGDVAVRFEYVWGANQEAFSLGKELIHPRTKDTLTFNKFQYYLSNIQLKRVDDNSWWKEPESYRIIDIEQAGSLNQVLKDLPSGTYSEVKFTIGVDSARNVSGAQTGALDPNEGLFWSWQTGYINIKAEGTWSDGMFMLHLGGFGGELNTISTLQYTLSTPLKVGEEGVNPKFTIVANPARMWHSSEGLSATSKIHMPSELASKMALDFGSGVIVTDAGN